MINVKIVASMDIAELIGDRETIMSLPRGSSLSDLLLELQEKYGEPITNFFYGTQRSLAQTVLLNGRNIAFLEGTKTKLEDGDEVFLVPIVAGG